MKTFRKKMPNGDLGGTYYVRYQRNGKRVTKSTGKSTQAEANEWVRTVLRPILDADGAEEAVNRAAAIVQRLRTVNLEDAWQHFLDKPRTRQPGADRLAFMKARWQRFVAWSPVNEVTAITPAIAQRYWRHVDAQRIAGATKSGHIEIVRRVLDACDSNVFDKLPNWQRKSVHRKVFSPVQLAEIAGRTDAWCYALFAFALHTGLREGDICNLRWEAVDLTHGWIQLAQSKTQRSVRIPLIGPVRGILESADRSGEYVFPEYKRSYDSDSISQHARNFLESLESVDATTTKPDGRDREVSVLDVHSCRHTFAYLAEQGGVPLSVIQSVIGHRTRAMTEHYTDHADDAAKLANLEKLGSAFGGAAINPLAGFSDEDLLAEIARRGLVAK